MNRREFLVVTGAVALAGILGIQVDSVAAAASPKTLYRGTPDGKLFESTNGGQSWELIADFTSMYAVLSAAKEADERINVHLSYWGFEFNLYSKDKTIWRTA
jgi:hypothetical protein